MPGSLGVALSVPSLHHPVAGKELAGLLVSSWVGELLSAKG